MLFVGIDIAKRNHEASVIAQDGRVVRKAMRFANSQAGYNKFMDMVRGLSEPCRVRYGSDRPLLADALYPSAQ